MSVPNNAANLPEGAVFQGRYRILRCLKAGGMGAVYECEHLSTQKRRALKVMLPTVVAAPGARERFELEARVTARIESEHIAETFDAGVDPESGSPFLVMELLRGEDLEAILEAQGPFSATETVTMLSQVALALDKTHAAGIVHRDLKPENFFLTTRDDGSPRVKILDFGIAKIVADTSKTVQQTATLGTPIYMSPEQMTGEGSIGPAADLFALGHIAYTLLTGEAYWQEDCIALPLYAFMSRMIGGATEAPSARAARRGLTLAPGFDAWFARATARAPADRFDRATMQVRELAAVLGTAPPRQLLGAPPEMSRRLSSPLAPVSGGPASAVVVAASTAHPSPLAALFTGPTVLSASAHPAAPAPSSGATGSGALGSLGSPVTAPVPAPSPSRARFYASVVLGALGAIVLAVGGVAAVRAASARPAPAVAATVLDPAVSAIPPGPSVPPAPSADPAPTAAPVVSPASASASAKVGVAPPPPPVRTTDARPATPKPAEPTKPTAPGKGCDPPYTVDSAGHHHPKPECL